MNRDIGRNALAVPARSHAASENGDARTMGAILVDEGRLTLKEAELILETQKREDIQFGDAAIKLGLLTPVDVQRALALQFNYAYVLPGSSGLSKELIAAHAPFSVEVERMRALRSQLILRRFGSSAGNALAIVSASTGEGKSYLAANLAIVFSQLGERTLLIDADLRHPQQHVLFKVANSAGLSTVLAGRVDGPVVQQINHFRDLSVLTAGPIPPNPLELLQRHTFANALEEWSRDFDVILIDTPTAKDNADAVTVVAAARGALLVVRKNRTRARDVIELRDQLAVTGAQLVGSVLTES